MPEEARATPAAPWEQRQARALLQMWLDWRSDHGGDPLKLTMAFLEMEPEEVAPRPSGTVEEARRKLVLWMEERTFPRGRKFEYPSIELEMVDALIAAVREEASAQPVVRVMTVNGEKSMGINEYSDYMNEGLSSAMSQLAAAAARVAELEAEAERNWQREGIIQAALEERIKEQERRAAALTAAAQAVVEFDRHAAYTSKSVDAVNALDRLDVVLAEQAAPKGSE